jgi:branched-chain amino acid transport system ATP-binding protein
MSLLEANQLKVSYGGINAVKGIDFHIEKGELVSLIGANGAGKTSTLKALCGLIKATGKINYAGTEITNLPSCRLVKQGLALVPEGRGIFSRLSVDENLHMGAYSRHNREEIRADFMKMYDLFPRLAERRKQVAGTLSGGEQQMLAIARALMSRPKLLLLDEPSMGLAPLMVNKIFETIKAVSAEGVTIFLVGQNAKLALEVSHRGYVMESGSIILSDSGQNLLESKQVRQAYLGE